MINNSNYNFTIHKNKSINEHIEKDLKRIKNLILENIPETLSILLVGGFGRGEGSFLSNEKFLPINDYDCLLVFKKLTRNIIKKCKQLSLFLAKDLKIDFVDLITTDLKKMQKSNFKNSIFYYESFYGHYIIYDRINIESILPSVSISSINSNELHKLLFNRALCLIEAIRLEKEYHNYDDQDNDHKFLIRQTSKAIIACSDVKLLFSGQYHHSYTQRCNIYKKLNNVSEKNKKLVELATKIKLDPLNTKLIHNPLDFWLEGVNLFSYTSRLFFSKYLKLQLLFSNIELIKRYLKIFDKLTYLIINVEKILLQKRFFPFRFYSFFFWRKYKYDQISLAHLILIESFNNGKLKRIDKVILSRLLKVSNLLNWNDYQKISIRTWYKFKH